MRMNIDEKIDRWMETKIKKLWKEERMKSSNGGWGVWGEMGG